MENATETTEVFTLLAVMALYGHSTSQSNTTAIGYMATGMHHHPQVLNGIPHVATLLMATVPL